VKADLEYVSKAGTLCDMQERLKECKAELREMKDAHTPLMKITLHTILKELLGEQ